MEEPFVTLPKKGRGYVTAYIDGERERFYNGKQIGIHCFPNKAKNYTTKKKLLSYLCAQVREKLKEGWRPQQRPLQIVLPLPAQEETQPAPSDAQCDLVLTNLRKDVEKEDISPLYIRDLVTVCDDLVDYLKKNELTHLPIEAITKGHVEGFLKPYKSSGTYYMNKRRTLSALFSRLDIKNPVEDTSTMKESTDQHLHYTDQQLKKILRFVKARNPHLYICCLLMYGCLLRPHQEIRILKRGHIDGTITKITLGKRQNKSRTKVRTVPIPEYVRLELIRYGITCLERGVNIFSKTGRAYNEHYFSTAWDRCRDILLEKGIIEQGHTLYSFRHTAAVKIYLKTKDPYKVQRALGHSSLKTTLIYLRNLGLIVDVSLEDLPDLAL